MQFDPLGGYAQFQHLTGRPVSLDHGSVSFAGGVVQDLVEGIRRYGNDFRTRFPSRGRTIRRPVAIGCVPWFSDEAVSLALQALGGHLLVMVDKANAHYRVVEDLASQDLGPAQRIFRDLIEMAPTEAGGEAAAIVPGRPMPGELRILGPVRVVGWRKQGNARVPILHTKLLLLGYWELVEGVGEFGEDFEGFVPVETWLGSANWTKRSRSSLEVGLWSSDAGLCNAALDYLLALVRFSEPYDSRMDSPVPELIDAVWDDAAFAAYAAELDGWDGVGPEAE